MPKRSAITEDLIEYVRDQRAAGEPWGVLLRDLAQAGLPANRSYWFTILRRHEAQRVAKRECACGAGCQRGMA